MTARTSRSVRHPDRVGLPVWLLAALTAATAAAAGLAGYIAAPGQVQPATGFLVGSGIVTLAVLGLASISVRMVACTMLFVSAAVLVRFGLLAGSLTSGGQMVLAWLVAAVVVLVLCDQVGTQSSPPLAREGAPGAAPSVAARSALGVAVIVVVLAAVLAPLLLPFVGEPTEAGQGASLEALRDGSASLRATSSLDMTTRPDLTDEVVFTVDSDRATFWRGETFDIWDGRSWTRSDDGFQPLLPGDRLQVGPDDLGARGDDVVEQRIRIEVSYAEVVHGAASATEVEIDRPVRQRPDGTLISAPMGRGTTYTVISRREPLSEQRLRDTDDGPTPESVAAQYAQEPLMTDRVRALAADITADATTRYDQVRAIESWMGERVEYSLDAPLAPKGVDVVDHFLFEAEQGWCEQIASSLVVLARANGIPARLVTGFVPDEQDPVTGVFTVRQRDAHAWAEVWFPEVGWVPFDPTANVSLAGDDAAPQTIAGWILDHLVVLALGAAVLALLAGPVRAWLKRRRAARATRPVGWAAVTVARLDALGARVDRTRRDHETATAYGAVLAALLGDERLTSVGQVIDDAAYAAEPPGLDRQAEVDAVLADLEAAAAQEPVLSS